MGGTEPPVGDDVWYTLDGEVFPCDEGQTQTAAMIKETSFAQTRNLMLDPQGYNVVFNGISLSQVGEQTEASLMFADSADSPRYTVGVGYIHEEFTGNAEMPCGTDSVEIVVTKK